MADVSKVKSEPKGKESPVAPPTYRRGLLKFVWYGSISFAIWVLATVLYRLRTEGRHGVPMEGPVVLLANHTSVFDPPIVGGSTRRQFSYLARDTLFVGPFSWLIRSLDAVPVDREGSGIAGIRATLKRLKQGGALVLFPEGTRSEDGQLQPFKPGFVALVRRGRATVVPLGLAGVGEVWPKGKKWPHLTGRIAMHYGEPLTPDDVADLTDGELVALVEQRVRDCVVAARALRSGSRKG